MSSPPEIETILTKIDEHDVFVVLGHEDPDADCLGSQKALGSWLERRGKTVHLCSAGGWDRPEIAPWQDDFAAKIPEINPEARLLTVILDCSSFDRTGFPEKSLPDAPVMVIDHHAAGSDFGDIRYVAPQMPSTTLLVQKIMEAAGDSPTPQEAEILFLGFCTDTGFFRHLEPGYGEPLELVSRLVENGANPGATFRMLGGGRSLGSRRLLGRILDRAELYFNGRLVVSWENWKDWRELGGEKDSDLLYQALLSIKGIEAAAVIKEQNDGICVVGLRSVTDLDVSDIARFLGGGGHRKAAGCSVSGDRHDVTEHLLQIFADRLN